MKKRKSTAVSGLVDSVESVRGEADSAPVSPTASVMDRRMAAIGHGADETVAYEKTNGKVKTVAQRWVAPGDCRMWSRHDRRYDLLNETRCADLIGGFKSVGQQFPAIVRELHDDPNYIYEVICGARRHWTATYLGLQYLIEVNNLSDAKAFLKADAENRGNDDLSEMERGLSYLQEMESGHYRTQAQFAAALDLSDDELRSYLELARLPQEIVDAYPTILTIKRYHAKKLTPLLNSPKARKPILEAAKGLKGSGKSPTEIFKLLLDAGTLDWRGKRSAQVERDYRGSDGKLGVRMKKTARGGLQLQIKNESLGVDELVRLAESAIREHFQ